MIGTVPDETPAKTKVMMIQAWKLGGVTLPVGASVGDLASFGTMSWHIAWTLKNTFVQQKVCTLSISSTTVGLSW